MGRQKTYVSLARISSTRRNRRKALSTGGAAAVKAAIPLRAPCEIKPWDEDDGGRSSHRLPARHSMDAVAWALPALTPFLKIPGPPRGCLADLSAAAPVVQRSMPDAGSRSDTDILSARGEHDSQDAYTQWPHKNGRARAVPRIAVVDRDWVAARKGSLAAPHRGKRTTGPFWGVAERPDLHATLGFRLWRSWHRLISH